jgi:hypothetical protein
MKKIILFLVLVLYSIFTFCQDSPPTGANFKTLPTYSFKYYTPTEAVWMYKGSTYGWTNLGKSLDTMQYYRLLNNHDSLNTLQEKSYNSLNDKPDLDLKANVDDPTFTTKITTPALNIPTSATLNYFWKCTNLDGSGAWAAVSASQVYKGTWNATTNTPTLADGTGTAGWYYRCVVAGTVNFGSGNITFAVGDDAYCNGTIWQKVPGGTSQWVTTGSDIYYNIGNVAIGMTAPTAKLTIGDTYKALDSPGNLFVYTTNTATTDYGAQISLGGSYSGTSPLPFGAIGARKVAASGGYLSLMTAVSGTWTLTEKMRLTESNVSIYSAVLSLSTDQQIQWGAADNYIWGHTATHYMGFATNGSERMRILSNGYLALGKTSATTLLDVNGVITATGGNSTNWNTAYTHSQIAGGNSVHVSTTENTQWDAAYTHSQIAGGNSVHVSTTENTQWDAAYTHSQIAGGNSVHVSTTENTNWDAAYTHSTDNTQAHSDYLLNNANDATSGSLTATNFILSSDRRLKTNIKAIDFKGVNIEYKQFELKSERGIIRFGVIAQDLQKTNPELVRTDKDGMLSVAYIDLLIKEISSLKQRVTELEKRLEK